jgi:D-amino-acid oxidase
VLKRAILGHISEASRHHHSGEKADVIVNCTGLLASKLGGVIDIDVIPTRGQIVLVRNDPGAMFSTSGTDDGHDEVCYIMKRAAGGGTILGGTYQKGNWNAQPDMEQAKRIMKRAVEVCPALTGGKGVEALDVIRHGVGLRPLRTGGVRIERERINGVWVVHNYGHGGWGYQGSYGCAQGAQELVDEVLVLKAKL